MKLRHTLIPALACISFIWSSCSSDSDIKPEPKTGMATITLNRPSKLQAAVAAAKPLIVEVPCKNHPDGPKLYVTLTPRPAPRRASVMTPEASQFKLWSATLTDQNLNPPYKEETLALQGNKATWKYEWPSGAPRSLLNLVAVTDLPNEMTVTPKTDNSSNVEAEVAIKNGQVLVPLDGKPIPFFGMSTNIMEQPQSQYSFTIDMEPLLYVLNIDLDVSDAPAPLNEKGREFWKVYINTPQSKYNLAKSSNPQFNLYDRFMASYDQHEEGQGENMIYDESADIWNYDFNESTANTQLTSYYLMSQRAAGKKKTTVGILDPNGLIISYLFRSDDMEYNQQYMYDLDNVAYRYSNLYVFNINFGTNPQQ